MNPPSDPVLLSSPTDTLRALDYEQTNETIRMLTDIRFKLLAAVPAASVAIIALVVEKPNQGVALIVGLFGLSVTFGLTLYELRNTQLYDAAIHRAKFLEQEHLKLASSTAGKTSGAIAGWIYLIAHSAIALLEVAALWVTAFACHGVFAAPTLMLFKLKGLLALGLALAAFVLFRPRFLKPVERPLEGKTI
ncbi:MAG: hypothetical protein QOH01_2368 [Verrucomicrobiota bacterium]|jgi:hypothetical protein